MNEQNRNTLKPLTLKLELPSWELIVLIVLLVTVLGVALRTPMKSFPDLAMRGVAMRELNRDPYDLRSERSFVERNRVETGL